MACVFCQLWAPKQKAPFPDLCQAEAADTIGHWGIWKSSEDATSSLPSRDEQGRGHVVTLKFLPFSI
jgi:hypothetical protein